MASLFTRLLSIDDVRKRFVQFENEVIKLESQKSLFISNSHEFQNIVHRCTELKKQIDSYAKKAEEVKVNQKDSKQAENKANIIEQLGQLSERLSSLSIGPKNVQNNKSPTVVESQIVNSNDNDEKVSSEESDLPKLVGDDEQELNVGSDEFIVDEYDPRSSNISKTNKFISVANFEAQEETDLSITRDEVLTILATREDGWWLAENKNGEKGLVPKTFLTAIDEDITVLDVEHSAKCKQQLALAQKTTADAKYSAKCKQQLALAQKTTADEEHSVKCEQKLTFAEKTTATHVVVNQPEILEVTKSNDNCNPPIMEEISEDSSPVAYNSKIYNSMTNIASPTIMTQNLGSIVKKETLKMSESLGDALKNDIHLTYCCHIMPKLSESNLGFHDIYWNYETNRLRKRRVRVNKIFRLIRVENIDVNYSNIECRLIRICLLDTSGQRGRQLVSNVHSIKAHIKHRTEKTWIFKTVDKQCDSIEFSDFFVRSNYYQAEVMLLIEASIVFNQDDELIEKPIGYFTMPIVGSDGLCLLQNKIYSQYLRSGNFFINNISADKSITKYRLVLRVSDIPENNIAYIDSLPDVLIWNPIFARILYYYRHSLGETLLKKRDNPLSTELIFEPFLATFPSVADQQDLMDLMRKLWNNKLKLEQNKKVTKTIEEEISEFREFYLRTAFVFYNTIPMPEYNIYDLKSQAIRDKIFKELDSSSKISVLKYLSAQRCHPLNIYDYAIDIVGPHAID